MRISTIGDIEDNGKYRTGIIDSLLGEMEEEFLAWMKNLPRDGVLTEFMELLDHSNSP